MAMEKIPLVSVIIPMYNSAKFIPQTLESLLYQTMKDFEVVVVDDCSSDNSVEVVESFKPKFISGGGYQKLHIVKLPKNTGTPGLPRNVGIQFARGKYIAFLDSDDLFPKTALEELTLPAEEYRADVINVFGALPFEDKNFNVKDVLEAATQRIKTFYESHGSNSKRVLELPNDPALRVNFWLANRFHWATCGLFCRRDFLISNQIFFPDMFLGEDQVVQFACLCLSEKLLSSSSITYLARKNPESVSRKNIAIENYFHRWVSSLNKGFNEFSKIMDKVTFFKEHPDYRYAMLNWFFNRVIQDAGKIATTYAQVHPAAIYPLCEKEFHMDDAAFGAYLFNTVNIQRLQIMQLQQELAKFQKQ